MAKRALSGPRGSDSLPPESSRSAADRAPGSGGAVQGPPSAGAMRWFFPQRLITRQSSNYLPFNFPCASLRQSPEFTLCLKLYPLRRHRFQSARPTAHQMGHWSAPALRLPGNEPHRGGGCATSDWRGGVRIKKKPKLQTFLQTCSVPGREMHCIHASDKSC